MAHRVRFAPAARRSSGMAHPCPRGCISRRNSAILAYRATALRHLSVGIHELWLPRPHRTSTGLLVSQSVGMAPDHAATGRHQHGRYNSVGTKAAPGKSSYHPCRCCAQGRFSAPSLPLSLHRAICCGGRLRPLPGAAAVVTGRCASDRPPAPAAPARTSPAPVRRPAVRTAAASDLGGDRVPEPVQLPVVEMAQRPAQIGGKRVRHRPSRVCGRPPATARIPVRRRAREERRRSGSPPR